MRVPRTYLISWGHIKMGRICKQFVAWMIFLLGSFLDSQLHAQVLRGNTNFQLQNTQQLGSNDASPTSFTLPSNPKTLPFLDTSVNLIQSHQVSTIEKILGTYEARSTRGKTIFHIGDEQVASLATEFHKGLMGNSATPGLFFPSTLANHSIPTDIKTSHTG